MNQLEQLSQRFPPKLIKAAPKGKFGSYIPHSTISERLLSIVGPYDLRVVQTLMGDSGQLEGIVLEMGFHIDGRYVTIQEAGDCEQPGNWKTQGARLKDAVSDGIKRCAMRVGCGTELWSQDDYFLDLQLAKLSAEETGNDNKEES